MMQRSASHSSKLMWQICKISPLRVRWMTVNVISWLLLLRVTVTVLEELTVLDAPKITKGWVVSPSKYQNCCCVAGPADPYKHGCLSALLKRPGLPMSPFAEPKKLGWKEMTNVYNKMIQVVLNTFGPTHCEDGRQKKHLIRLCSDPYGHRSLCVWLWLFCYMSLYGVLLPWRHLNTFGTSWHASYWYCSDCQQKDSCMVWYWLYWIRRMRYELLWQIPKLGLR